MGNIFVNLPVPSANAAGAAVDVSAMGKTKTIVIGGVGGPFKATVNIEYATDAAGTSFAPLVTFQNNGGNETVNVAARWMRAVTENYQSGAINCDVGGSDSGTLFAQIPSPPPGGVGAPVDISGLPLFKTVVVSDGFKGAINIQVSADGISYSEVMTFNDSGGKSASFFGAFVRATSSNGSPSEIFIGGAESDDQSAIDNPAPTTSIVFRPGAVGDLPPNVYTTWATAYAALQSVADRGAVYLEFDARFSSTVDPASGSKSCVIPAGVWNMTNVTWTNTLVISTGNSGRTFVELASGASIVVTAPIRTLKIIGWSLTVFSNRTNPLHVAPFVGVDLILGGTRSELRNTLLVPGALPSFVIGPSGSGQIVIDGSNSQGGIGGGGSSGNPPSVSPVIDLAGGFLALTGGAGHIKNNSLTDSLGGGFALLRAKDDNFNGTSNSAEDFDFPALASGSFQVQVEARPRRFVEDLGGAFVTPADSPWAPFYNELVACDPAGGGIAGITCPAPSALARGEQFTVSDAAGTASALDTILIVPTGGDTLAGPVGSDSIITPFGSRTYVSNGYGTWLLVASV